MNSPNFKTKIEKTRICCQARREILHISEDAQKYNSKKYTKHKLGIIQHMSVGGQLERNFFATYASWELII